MKSILLTALAMALLFSTGVSAETTTAAARSEQQQNRDREPEQVGVWTSQAGAWSAVGARFEAEIQGRHEMGVVCTVKREAAGGTFTIFQRRVDRPNTHVRVERGFLYNPNPSTPVSTPATAEEETNVAPPANTRNASVVLRAGTETTHFSSRTWTDGRSVGGILNEEDLGNLIDVMLNNQEMTLNYRGPIVLFSSQSMRGELRIPLDGARVAMAMMVHCGRVMAPLRLPEERAGEEVKREAVE